MPLMWMKANLVNLFSNDDSAGVTAGYTLLRVVVVQGSEVQCQAIYAAGGGGLMNHERKKTDPVPVVDSMTNEENTHRSHRDWSDNSRSKPPVPGRELPVREASIASRRY